MGIWKWRKAVPRPMSLPSKVIRQRVDRPDIGASEVGDFFFCERSWWLRRAANASEVTDEQTTGSDAHWTVGHVIAARRRLERAATVLLALALGGTLVVITIQVW